MISTVLDILNAIPAIAYVVCLLILIFVSINLHETIKRFEYESRKEREITGSYIMKILEIVTKIRNHQENK